MSINREQIAATMVLVDSRVLLLQRSASSSYPLQWCLPGGKINRGESPEDAALRELREETLLEVPKSLIKHRELNRVINGHPISLFVASVTSVQLRPVIAEPRKHCGIGWFSSDDLEAMGWRVLGHSVIRELM